MTPEKFKVFAQALLNQYTPDELWDFLDSQGAFDKLKQKNVEELKSTEILLKNEFNNNVTNL